jgi:arylsulfatase A-like enzyme
VGGDTSQWQPNLFRHTTQIYRSSNPGWNLITAMADDAIHWMRQLNDINPSMPRAVDFAAWPRAAPGETGS